MTKFTAAQIKQINKENLKWPVTLIRVPATDWPENILVDKGEDVLLDVFRSRTHQVMIFRQSSHGNILRMSVNRTDWDERQKRFRDDISWDDMQRLKAEAGYKTRCGLEVYPPDHLIVNVANMRHMFILPEGNIPSFVWQ